MILKNPVMIVLPGGMPGTTNLKEDENVRKAVQEAYDDGKICGSNLCGTDNSRRYGTFKRKESDLLSRLESEIEDAYLNRSTSSN